ncbi:hypothetical protein P618_200836 [Holospora obtusa F1]|uniref:Uncharacterized protein n=1 Tax=Holospora obtusa F1 TaxID=1399147 RepID=W6TD89_HOLOB|nr:hypothetical protein [Holospora obtusa]ETZ06938.1 hypothetical protein P618_200836 [Holospora obtusa F1]
MKIYDMVLKTNYESLQDVMDEIFYYDDGHDHEAMGVVLRDHWMEFLPKFAVKKDLLKALDHYFNMWDLGERGVDYLEKVGEFFEYERASWCFYYLFMTLEHLEDPSFIPSVMKYFPDEWYMEGMWSQPMVGVITNYEKWGATYISWLMRSLHLLPSGALNYAAKDFMIDMILDTFFYLDPGTFPDLFVVDVLPLGRRNIVQSLLEEIIEDRKKCLLEHKDNLQLNCMIPRWRQTLVCAEYVLGQLLLLPEEVVGIGHR